MNSETYMPLTAAAHRAGVSTRTFRRWLERDGFVVRERYQRVLLSEADFEKVIAKRRAVQKHTPIRRLRKAS